LIIKHIQTSIFITIVKLPVWVCLIINSSSKKNHQSWLPNDQ